MQFAELGLVVVDEQHRFGVEQRDALRDKAAAPPHLLVMTATPIPRTVAMTVFGDLETSTLTELPAGRAPIATSVVPVGEKPAWLDRAWQRIREEVAAGRQAYVVCPRIGDDVSRRSRPTSAELDDVPTTTDGAGRRPPLAVSDVLRDAAPTGRCTGCGSRRCTAGCTPDEKDRTMPPSPPAASTCSSPRRSIEVGVDVPNATVMVVMDADRFGVSQLHQLRGRVGRGGHPGLCLLVTELPDGAPARERLDAVAATTDGFELARLDVEQRREGDVLGVAQSGRPLAAEAAVAAARRRPDRRGARRGDRRSSRPTPTSPGTRRSRPRSRPWSPTSRPSTSTRRDPHRRRARPRGAGCRPRPRHPPDVRTGPRGAVQLAARASRPRRRAVLDLFAGSGAVGLEALSRGAAPRRPRRVRPRAADVLRRNVAAVGLPGARRAAASGRRPCSPAPDEPFDLVFADPPYALGDDAARRVLAALAAHGWLAESAIVVVERSRARPNRPGRTPSRWSHNAATGRLLWYGRATLTSADNVIRRARLPGFVRPGDQRPSGHHRPRRQLYDELTVAVFVNQRSRACSPSTNAANCSRKRPPQYGNVRIDSFHGLLVDYCKEHGIAVIVKGLRAVSDFDYELQMAQMNRGLAGIDTLFMPTNPEYSFLASSLVKEIAKWGGDVSALVPPNVLKRLIDRTNGA